MRKLVIVIFLLPCIWATAQRNANFGIIGGISYYMGDINPNRHFYKPSPAIGLIYRININPRYAIRGNAYYTTVSGSDLDFPELLHPDRPYVPITFSASLLDLNIQGEFNFLPFTPNIGRFNYTPYVSTGLGLTMAMSGGTGASHHLTFPFGIGAKLNISKRLSTGLEWSFRKAFTDLIDTRENPTGIQSVIHNNDWYSYLGIFITYKFLNFVEDCPAYD
ncbi:MAG: outer membrane beta-barrel protein [Bacteroidales bacterium]|nr:outer membrane beta-barrel protein [Bacteroidales bacterium]MBN2764297.1 outer membrane beta-barrel protein [Bacteroidales bacterium]